jgi:hypothetical protein
VGSQRAAYCRLGIPLRRRYAEEHDKLIVRLSHLLGSVGRHKRVDLIEVEIIGWFRTLLDSVSPLAFSFQLVARREMIAFRRDIRTNSASFGCRPSTGAHPQQASCMRRGVIRLRETFLNLWGFCGIHLSANFCI